VEEIAFLSTPATHTGADVGEAASAPAALSFERGRRMIALRRNSERLHVKRGKQDRWLTFHAEKPPGPSIDAFGSLIGLDETRMPPGGGSASYPTEEAEIITYVYRGALAQEDSTGNSGVVHAGEFQRMNTRRGIRRKETNASRSDWAHIFRVTLRPGEVGLVKAHEQQRFGAAQRRNVLCVVASPDGRKGSLPISQDALIYSAVVDAGHHLIHELQPGRNAWLHLIDGEASLQDIVMTRGDGGGWTAERSVSLTAQEHAELLLVDLGPAPRSSASDAPRRTR
jgi:redox-sensitive bicupin YhaK (pirin superfamily)